MSHGHRPALPRALRVPFWCSFLATGIGLPAALQAQAATAGAEAPEVVSAIPARIATAAPTRGAHLHLEGSFPTPSHDLLRRLAVWAHGTRHSCALGWSQGAIDALMATSRQPWMNQDDVLDERENREGRECGSIDGLWADRLQISINHPRLLSPGVLRIGVALYPMGQRGSGARLGVPSESWIDVPVAPPFRVVGRTPRAPVAREGEPLHLSFAVIGGPPTDARLERGNDSVELPFDVEGDRVTVTLAPQLYRAPLVLTIRLSRGAEQAQVAVPVCLGEARSGVVCPPA